MAELHQVAGAPYLRPPVVEVTREPLPYTGTPWKLLLSDFVLFLKNFFYLPYIFVPLWPWPSGPLDELYPSASNLIDIAFHTVLFFTQLGFFISLFILTFLPAWSYFSYIVGFLITNELICRHFNRCIPQDGLKSTEDARTRQWARHDDEYWIFLNGICVGRNWLQNNIDRLSRTFHRPVVGIHNKTYLVGKSLIVNRAGVVFDLIQCLIQRALLYATQDVRDCYVLVKKALLDKDKRKVVLMLHSQGGIEGGMIVDWLLNELPSDVLQKLEIYTFGCLANHFSNPMRNFDPNSSQQVAAIAHIEHYANQYDFACRAGVLHFTKHAKKKGYANRFMGQVFVNRRGGHQLNQHYMSSIFPMDDTFSSVREPIPGDFMDMDVRVKSKNDDSVSVVTRAQLPQGLEVSASNQNPNGDVSAKSVPKMKNLSRLWQYRNGGSPV